MMKASINEMKREAADRLRSLALHPDVLTQWVKNGTIYCSDEKEGLYPISKNNKRFMSVIEELEEWYGLPYHALHGKTALGETLILLFVCDDSEEWEMEKEDLVCIDTGSIVYAYIYFFDNPSESVIEGINLVKQNGQLIAP